IGLEGHSMGGWAVLAAAVSQPDGYESMVLEGSATGVFGAPAGSRDFPRNVAVVFSAYDEFAELMWGVPLATSIGGSDKLLDLFNATALVEANRVYGDIDTGNGRAWNSPNVTHPGDHHSRAAIGHALDWFAQTLGAPRPLPTTDQVWYWKELGTLLMLIAIVVLLVGFTSSAIPLFGVRYKRVTAPNAAANNTDVWAVAALALLPVITYLPLFKLADIVLPPNRLLPQQITNGVVVWMIGNAMLSALLLRVRGGFGGFDFDGGAIARALGAAVVGVGATYAALWIVFSEWAVDARFWVLAVKPFAPWHWAAFAVYLLPMLVFFPLLGVVLSRVWQEVSTCKGALGL